MQEAKQKWYVEDPTEMVRQSRRIEADQKKKKNKKHLQRMMMMMMERRRLGTLHSLLSSSSSLFVVARVVVSVGVVYIHIHTFKLVPLSNQ